MPPTIYEWAGGTVAFQRWLNAFYDLVEEEPSLAPLFGGRASEEQRLRFVTLLSEAADQVELPADPEFRAAIVGYAEWGSRLAMHNSAEGAEIAEEAPVPRWGWGVAPPFEG